MKILGKFTKKKTILSVWVLSYVVITLVIITANLYISSSASDKIQNEQNRTIGLFLDNVRIKFDSMFTEMDFIREDIGRDQKIFAPAYESEFNNETRYQAIVAMAQVSEKMAKYTNISECLIYYPRSDIIVSSKVILNSKDYFRLNVKNYEENYQKFKKLRMMKSYHEWVFTLSSEYPADVFCVSYPVTDLQNNIEFTICVIAKKENIFQGKDSTDLFAVLDRRGNTIVSDGDLDLRKVLFSADSEPKRININGENKILYHLKSPKFPYRYVYLTPENGFFQKIMGFNTLFIGINFICTVFVLFIMYSLSHWNYKEIKNILSIAGIYNASEENEYMTIKNEIKSLHNQRAKMKHLIDQQDKVMRNSFLTTYLKGYGDKRIEEGSKMYDVHFKWDYFAVAALYIENFGIFEEHERDDAMFAVNNILEDMSDGENFVLVQTDGMLFYIINLESDDLEEYKKMTNAVFGKVRKSTLEIIGLDFIIGASNIGKTLNCLPQAYSEAVRTVESAKFFGVYDFLFFSDIERENTGIGVYNQIVLKSNELLEFVEQGESDKAQRLIRETFDMREVKNKWFITGLINIVLYNIFNENNYENIDDNVNDKIRIIGNGDNLYESVDALCEIIDTFCRQNSNQRNSVSSIYTEVKKYIDNNYTQAELNVATIGLYFNMSPYYISRLFKKYDGKKITEYINELRIKEAKRILLSDSSIKVENLALMAGFENKRTFLRIFKEYEGITPSQFRTLYKI